MIYPNDWRLITSAFACFVVLLVGGPEMARSGSAVTENEYDVMSAALEHAVKGQPAVVLESRTSVDSERELLSNEIRRQVMRELKLSSSDILKSFQKINRGHFELEARLRTSTRYRLVSHQELAEMWDRCESGTPCGWELFYKRFPEAAGVVLLSRVGFDSKGSEAVVFVEFRQNWKQGIGHLLRLQKDSGTWRVASHMVVTRQ